MNKPYIYRKQVDLFRYYIIYTWDQIRIRKSVIRPNFPKIFRSRIRNSNPQFKLLIRIVILFLRARRLAGYFDMC